MKILFETYGGRKIQKRFAKLNEVKEYVLRNKAFIKEAQINKKYIKKVKINH